MFKFRNIPIVTRLIFLVTAITLLMLGTIIYATTDGLRSLAKLDSEMQQTLDNIQAFDQVNYMQARNRGVLLDALANPEPDNVARRVEEFLNTRAEVTAAAKKYEASIQEGKQRELYDAWRTSRAAYAKENDAFMAALSAGKMAEASRISQEKLVPLYEPIKAAIANITRYNLEQQELKTAQVKAASLRTQYVSIATLVALTVIIGLLAWAIIRTISSSLRTLRDTIARIATLNPE